ncbi:hypothetical protein SDJN02_21445, partial [Cucurbita argyrosperma subsp. argyrosperma]
MAPDAKLDLVHRVDTTERRDEHWHLRTGRNDVIGSSSHSYGQARKMPNYEEDKPQVSCSLEFEESWRFNVRNIGYSAKEVRALRQDTVIWVPEILPKEEAVVHKEDLIIWPPVIIVCNIFLSHSNPDKRRVVTIEALESFLRSKNLLRGRVKMNLRVSCRWKCNGVEVPAHRFWLTDAERLDNSFLKGEVEE